MLKLIFINLSVFYQSLFILNYLEIYVNLLSLFVYFFYLQLRTDPFILFILSLVMY